MRANSRNVFRPLVTAFALGLLGPQVADAAVALGTSASDPDNYATFSGVTLQSVTLGGTEYTTDDMVQITLTGFVGASTATLLVQNTGLNGGDNFTISAADRRALLETDWRADTGIINPDDTTASFQADFNQPLVNLDGVDLIIFEIDPTAPSDGLFLTISGSTIEITGSSFGNTGVATSSADTLNIRNSGNTANMTPANLTDLLNNPVQIGTNNISQTVFGVGIDLSDFGVASGASVTSFSLYSNSPSAFIDPVIIAGIVPEPSTFLLLGGAFAGLAFSATGRRAQKN